MYAGHIGIALGAKGIRDSIPLWVLVLATQLPDWTDAGLCVAGVRTAIPGIYTHSFPAVAVLAAVASLFYYAMSRDSAGPWIVGAVVVTHALADYVTGLKPTWPGGPMIGMRLYSYPLIDFVVETLVIGAGWWSYRRTFSDSRRNTWPVNLMPVALVIFQLAAVIAFSLSPTLRKC